MKQISYFFVAIYAVVALSGCHKTNSRQENSTVENDTINHTYWEEDTIFPDYTVRYIDDVSLEEFDTVYAEAYIGNAAGYAFTFEQYIAQTPQTMHFSFPVMQNAEDFPLHIVDAPDGKIRFYGWNSGLGGSSISWNSMYQVEDNGTVYTFNGLPDWDTESMLPTRIYKLPHPTKNYYLIFYYFRISGSEAYRTAITYELNGNELKRVNLVKANETLTDRVEYEYRLKDDEDESSSDTSNLPRFDEQNSILFFPNPSTPQDNQQHLDRYQWNNELLVKTT